MALFLELLHSLLLLLVLRKCVVEVDHRLLVHVHRLIIILGAVCLVSFLFEELCVIQLFLGGTFEKFSFLYLG